MDKFQEHVPTTATFDIGYFEDKQQSKIWLVTLDDLHKMYGLYPKGGEVLLWCDGISDVGTESRVGSKHSLKEADATASKRSRQECEIESVYKELSEKHQQTWDVPRLKLWARCIVSGGYDYDNSPKIPAFQAQHKHRRE